MKRRFANAVEGQYSQKRFDEEMFKGYISNIKIQNVANPLIVNNGISKVCIKDNNYEWFEVYPDNSHYAITIMYDDKNNLIEWYTLNVFTEYNGLDLTRLGGNYLMMIHYSK